MSAAGINQPAYITITKQGTPSPECLVPFILSNELFKPIRVPFLPVPTIPYHLFDPILRTPAKLALSLRRVRVYDRNVAGTAVINDIRNLDAIHPFKCFYELQNAVALPCSQVIRNQATVVLDRLESVHVASGEVHDVDVVPDAGTIRRVIVIPEYMQLLQHPRYNLSNTRPLMPLAIYRMLFKRFRMSFNYFIKFNNRIL